MDAPGLIISIITALTAVFGVTIALIQLQAGRKDAKASRMAELSWQIYQEYNHEYIIEARTVLENIGRNQPIPQSGEEFGAMYVTLTHQYKEKPREERKYSNVHVRRILRFYHQVGILLKKGLIDPDFVFPLIGYGLETSRHTINVACEWYQNYYGGDTGREFVPKKRDIYNYAPELCEMYNEWKKATIMDERDR
jgi:hypothetical protein